jgi:hypothetical protein
MLKVASIATLLSWAQLRSSPAVTDQIRNVGCRVELRCCSVSLLLLSPRVCTLLDDWSPVHASLSGAPMIPVHRATVVAFEESIPEISNVCASDQTLKFVHANCEGHVIALDQLLHVSRVTVTVSVRRKQLQVIEQQCHFAMTCSRVEILTEEGTLSSSQLFELSQHCKVDRLMKQNSERDSSVLGATIARMSQRRALSATSKQRDVRCMSSNVMAFEFQCSIVDASHSYSQVSHAAPTSENR